jgi:peptidyl-tRNA hydrolase
MKELNVIKEPNGSFTINVESKAEVTFKEPIPFYGIYEEKIMENDKFAIASNSTFKYSSGADVQKVWKAYGWIPPSTVRNDYLFKANRIASGLSK